MTYLRYCESIFAGNSQQLMLFEAETLSVQSVTNPDENASSHLGVLQINVSFDNSRRQNVSAVVFIVSGCTVDASGPSTLRGKVLSYDKSKFSRITVRISPSRRPDDQHRSLLFQTLGSVTNPRFYVVEQDCYISGDFPFS